MNILLITYEIADKGGNFIRALSLARELAKENHQITILCSNKRKTIKTKRYKNDKVNIVEIGDLLPSRLRHNGTSPIQIIRRVNFVIKNKFDLIHGFGHRPAVLFPASIGKLLYKTPYIADWSDLWGWGGLATYRSKLLGLIMGHLDEIFERFSYSYSDAVTVISDYLYKKTIELRKNKKNVYKIKVGANWEIIKPLDKKKSRIKYKIPTGKPVVLFLGNAPYDEEFLANSFVELKKINSEALFIFIGKQMLHFNSIITKNSHIDDIIHFGFVENNKISEILACADVMLMPYSKRIINLGRYPNKIGDYISSGRPTVTNPTGEIKNLFKKYPLGLMANEDPKEFSIKINFLLNNKNLSKRIGMSSARTAKEKLSWNILSKKLEIIYFKLVKDSDGKRIL